MADLSTFHQTYSNAGVGIDASFLDANKTAGNRTQGIAGRTRIISLSKSNMTTAELEAALLYMQAGDVSGTNDAVTVVGVTADGGDAGGTNFVSGETDVVHVAVQGTGVMTAGSNYGTGSTGVTMAVVADFEGLF
mgnify:CR=1 FL=1